MHMSGNKNVQEKKNPDTDMTVNTEDLVKIVKTSAKIGEELAEVLSDRIDEFFGVNRNKK